MLSILPKEIKTAVRWGFRALQIPAGYNIVAGEMVLYQEIIHRNGLVLLNQMFETHNRKEKPQSTKILERFDHSVDIDVHHQHVLLVIPTIFDYCLVQAQKKGSFTIRIHNLGGGQEFIEQQLYATGQKGVIGIWRAADWTLMGDPYLITRREGKLEQPFHQIHLSSTLHPQGKSEEAIATKEIKARYADVNQHGILVEPKIWEPIEKVARQILVPAKK